MMAIYSRLLSRLCKVLDSSMSTTYVCTVLYANGLNFSATVASPVVAAEPKKSTAFTRFRFVNPKKICALKSSSCAIGNGPATKSFPLWCAPIFGKMFWVAYATARPSTAYLSGSAAISGQKLISSARKALQFPSTKLETLAYLAVTHPTARSCPLQTTAKDPKAWLP